jgi:hypothetical protein
MQMEKSQRTKDLETLIVLALASGIIGRVFAVKAAEGAALLLLITALVMPKAAYRIAAVWLKFGTFIGRINSRILLTIIFYLVLTPMAFLYRLFSGGNSLGLRRDPADGSFWHVRNRAYSREDFERCW